MKKEFSCHNCESELVVDLERGPSGVFIVACPSCAQRYKVTKPTAQGESSFLNSNTLLGSRDFTCHGCDAQLTVVLDKGPSDIFIVACPSCAQRYQVAKRTIDIGARSIAVTTHLSRTAERPALTSALPLDQPKPTSGPIPKPEVSPQAPMPSPTDEVHGKRSARPWGYIGAGVVLLISLSAWWYFDLRLRHTLTDEERGKGSLWMAGLQSGPWVLVDPTEPEVVLFRVVTDRPQVSADTYGQVSIGLLAKVEGVSSSSSKRYEAKADRLYTDLDAPSEYHLKEPGYGTNGSGHDIYLRFVTPDSLTVELAREDGSYLTLAGLPEKRFAQIVAERKASFSEHFMGQLNLVMSGGGLLRKGIFQKYECSGECFASFMEVLNGRPVLSDYLCNSDRFGDIRLSAGSMVGEGEFTNTTLVGQEFLFVTKPEVVQQSDGSSLVVEYIEGLLYPPIPEQLATLPIVTTGEHSAAVQPTISSTVLPVASTPSIGQGTSTKAQLQMPEELHDLAAVQQQPEFPGGMEKMYEFMGRVQRYPDAEADAGTQGKVYVEFVVEKDGRITEVKTKRGVSPGLDREAERIIRSMPPWSPGKMNDKPVRCRFVLPVKFTLR